MSRMTCRNGFVFVAAICLGLIATSARGGDLNPPAAPTSSASAMWTLNNIYNVLDTRTTNVHLRPGGFTEPSGGPTNGTMHTLNEIMTLVTNRAPVPKTGQTRSYAPYYDDGWYGTNVGVAWPNPRFTTNGAPETVQTNQIRDNLTGLIWARNANLPGGTMPYTNAMEYCRTNLNVIGGHDYNYGGTNDWRLPNRRELDSLVKHGEADPSVWLNTQGFTGVQSASYWSSTEYKANASSVWLVRLSDGGDPAGDFLPTTKYYVWPVRGGGQ